MSGNLNTALSAFRAGDLRAAEKACRAVLDRTPSNLNASLLMGMIKASLGDFQGAEHLFRRVALSQPNRPDVHFNLGLVLVQQNRPQDALTAFDKALTLDPNNLAAHVAKGNALSSLQQLELAIASFDRALRINPALTGTWFERGRLLQELGRSSDALTSYERIIALAPANADALNAAGTVLTSLGRFEEAVERFSKAIGNDPEFAAAYSNRAVARNKLQQLEFAEADHRRALELTPTDPAVLANYAEFLDANNRPEEAKQTLARLEPLDPVTTLVLRGNVLADQLRLEEARACYERAIAAQPNLAFAHWCRGLLDLREGRLREGFAGFERRSRTPRILSSTEWQPQTAKPGARLFLYAEHGLGDTIQFARYVPLLIDQGYAVTVEVQPALVTLCQSLHPALRVIAAGNALPTFDYHCALPSLPFNFGTDLNSIPARVPYLMPGHPNVTAWASKLDNLAAPRIGVCWAGNPAHQRDAKRSIPFATFLKVFENQPVSLVSLQKDVRERDLSYFGQTANISDWTQHFANFADAAALIDRLDLVVTVDTSMAHLAGALGKRVWILLPYAPDWRWMLGKCDTPWYPTAKLFRQSEPGDWSGVLQAVADELQSAIPHGLKAASFFPSM